MSRVFMELDRFLDLRPILFHTTALANLDRIKAERCLQSTQSLSARAAPPVAFSLDRRRATVATLRLIPGGTVHVRDQAPLYEGNIRFEGDWSFGHLVRRLNQLVFFWPGTNKGPNDYGLRHAARYQDAAAELAFLRLPSRSVVDESTLFSSVNSGSPRFSNGKPSVRGPGTFLPASQFAQPPSGVVEVVFEASLGLPPETEWSRSLAGGWCVL
jgi:uncharacterized protein DUF7002